MKRFAIFMLLAALSIAWPLRAKAQGMSGAEYGRESREAAKKMQKKQNRLMKKAAKKQRKAMKKLQRTQTKQARKTSRRVS